MVAQASGAGQMNRRGNAMEIGGIAKRPGMLVAAIAAMARNRVIGRAGQIPWRIPGEQLLFKRITIGHTVIMGRRTYASMQRPLVERTNIVISRQPEFRPPGCLTAGSLQAALDICPPGETEAFIIGGGQLYAEALPITDRIYLSVIPREVAGDTWFPEIPESEFRLARIERVAGPEPYDFCIYERVSPRPASS
jgi:dihydrofolate reductase